MIGLLGDASGKEPSCQYRRPKRRGFDPRVGKIAWRREWQPPPGFLPGESHGQRSLAGYSQSVHNESDMTEATWRTHMSPNAVTLGVRTSTYGFYRTNIQPVRGRTEPHLFLLNSDGISASHVGHRVRTHTVMRARLLASLWKLVKSRVQPSS